MINCEIDWNGLLFYGRAKIGRGCFPSFEGEFENNIVGNEKFVGCRFGENIIQGLAYQDDHVTNFWATLE